MVEVINMTKPYGRDIPEKSAETTANKLTGRFNKTSGDLNSGKKKKLPKGANKPD